MNCEGCGEPLPPANGNRPRRWHSDKCRKAAERRRESTDPADSAPVTLVGRVSVAEAVLEYVKGLEFEAGDPRLVMIAVALRLAEGLDRTGSATLARELRNCMTDLWVLPDAPPGAVHELRARYLARRADGLIEWAMRQTGLDDE